MPAARRRISRITRCTRKSPTGGTWRRTIFTTSDTSGIPGPKARAARRRSQNTGVAPCVHNRSRETHVSQVVELCDQLACGFDDAIFEPANRDAERSFRQRRRLGGGFVVDLALLQLALNDFRIECREAHDLAAAADRREQCVGLIRNEDQE